MENIEAPKPSFKTPGYKSETVESKKYELKCDDDIYLLII